MQESEEIICQIIDKEQGSSFFKNPSNWMRPLLGNDVIINLTPLELEDIKQVNDLAELSLAFKSEGNCLVFVSKLLAIDELSEEIDLVPTLEEAYDFIAMERMQRDLGI